MDWKTFISAIIGHVIWPLAVLFIFFMFRNQLVKLLDKVEHLKYKDVELDFEIVKKQAIEIASSSKNSVEKNQAEKIVFTSLEQQILETVETSPPASILLAWSAVETALSAAVSRISDTSESPSFRSPIYNIEILERSGELTKRHVNLITEMRVLRNKITHGDNSFPAVTESQALDYAQTAIAIVNTLKTIDRYHKVLQMPTGKWIQLPENFVPIDNNHSSGEWIYSNIPLVGTELTAGLGPLRASSIEKYASYGIDIELPIPSGHKIIDELRFDLSYVSEETLTKKARELIVYDSKVNVVTFDLGKSIFKYQLL